jgi:hypothetical protein
VKILQRITGKSKINEGGVFTISSVEDTNFKVQISNKKELFISINIHVCTIFERNRTIVTVCSVNTISLHE